MVGPDPDLLAVDVHKRRERFTLGGCMAEVTEVRTEYGSTHTIAIESEDASRVIATVREVGLAARPERELRARAQGAGPVRHASACAVVDVGTNSVKFHIGERSADGGWRKIVDRAQPTRLGDGLQETGSSIRNRCNARSKPLPTWPRRPGGA